MSEARFLSPAEFSTLARQLQAEAERLCAECPDADLEQWMEMAKAKEMTWVEGVEWVVRQQSTLSAKVNSF